MPTKKKPVTSKLPDTGIPKNGKMLNVRWTKQIEEFILDKMCDGMDPTTICRVYQDKVPVYKTLYRRSLSDPVFREKFDQAYTILLMRRLDELHEVSSSSTEDAYPGMDWRQAEALLKRRVDAMKFTLGKMAPVLSNKFNTAKKLEIESNVPLGPQIAVINYYKNPELELDSGSVVNTLKNVSNIIPQLGCTGHKTSQGSHE